MAPKRHFLSSPWWTYCRAKTNLITNCPTSPAKMKLSFSEKTVWSHEVNLPRSISPIRSPILRKQVTNPPCESEQMWLSFRLLSSHQKLTLPQLVHKGFFLTYFRTTFQEEKVAKVSFVYFLRVKLSEFSRWKDD